MRALGCREFGVGRVEAEGGRAGVEEGRTGRPPAHGETRVAGLPTEKPGACGARLPSPVVRPAGAGVA